MPFKDILEFYLPPRHSARKRPRFNAQIKALYSNNMLSKFKGIAPDGSKVILISFSFWDWSAFYYFFSIGYIFWAKDF